MILLASIKSWVEVTNESFAVSARSISKYQLLKERLMQI